MRPYFLATDTTDAVKCRQRAGIKGRSGARLDIKYMMRNSMSPSNRYEKCVGTTGAFWKSGSKETDIVWTDSPSLVTNCVVAAGWTTERGRFWVSMDLMHESFISQNVAGTKMRK